MSVAGLCVVFISGWVWIGEVAEPIGSGVPCGAVRGPAGSGGGGYISVVQVGITVVCWRVVSSL